MSYGICLTRFCNFFLFYENEGGCAGAKEGGRSVIGAEAGAQGTIEIGISVAGAGADETVAYVVKVSDGG